MTFRTCDNCGAALDPGEICDCRKPPLPALRCDKPPIIFENLDSVRLSLAATLEEVRSLPLNDESLKKIKSIRAEMSKSFEALEDQRKEVKRQVMAPYLDAEHAYKEKISTPFQKADGVLKLWIDTYQNGLKQKCEQQLREYFSELCQAQHIDFLKFEDCGVTVDMAMARQKEPRKAMDAIFQFVSRVRSDVDAIADMDYAADIFAVYKNRLDLAQSISIVEARKREVQLAQEQVAAQRETTAQDQRHAAQLLAAAPEAATPEDVYSVSFVATGTLSALKKMKALGASLGVTFEEIEQEDA